MVLGKEKYGPIYILLNKTSLPMTRIVGMYTVSSETASAVQQKDETKNKSTRKKKI